jgi:hypothetical protein
MLHLNTRNITDGLVDPYTNIWKLGEKGHLVKNKENCFIL